MFSKVHHGHIVIRLITPDHDCVALSKGKEIFMRWGIEWSVILLNRAASNGPKLPNAGEIHVDVKPSPALPIPMRPVQDTLRLSHYVCMMDEGGKQFH